MMPRLSATGCVLLSIQLGTAEDGRCWRYQPVAFTASNAVPYVRQSLPPSAVVQPESSSVGEAQLALSPAISFHGP